MTGKEYSALKKCNNIGKKLNKSSSYILINAMMLGWNEQGMDETEANPLGVSFIETKLLEQLGALAYLGIMIDGNKLYQYDKTYEFSKFQLTDKYLNIIYISDEIETLSDCQSVISSKFGKYALEKGFTKKDIEEGAYTEYMNSDIELYELYIKFKKGLISNTVRKEKIVKCRIIDSNNFILKKTNKVMSKLKSANVIYEKDIEPDLFNTVLNNNRPIVIKFNNKGSKPIIRLMKSLFNTATTKSNISMKVVENEDNSYLILYVGNTGFLTCLVYRVLLY
jgi:hypothetical protein